MDDDTLELAQLGYKQEFKRAFSALHVFGFVFSLFGLFSSMSYVFLHLQSAGSLTRYSACSGPCLCMHYPTEAPWPWCGV